MVNSEEVTGELIGEMYRDISQQLASGRMHILVCGPTAMEKAVLKQLGSLGVDTNSDDIWAFTLGNKEPTSPELDSHGKPLPPTTCCNNFCANCVWMEYVKDLQKYLHSQNKPTEGVAQLVDALDIDPGLKAFLQLELKEPS